METLRATPSFSPNLYLKNNSHKALFTKPQFSFFRLQKPSNVKLSHSLSLQFKAVHSISCSASPLSTETVGDVENAENTEAPTQSTSKLVQGDVENAENVEAPTQSTSKLVQGDVENAENGEAPTQSTDQSKTVHVKFQLQKECLLGKDIHLVGDDPILGAWNPSNAIPLEWSDGHIWSVELDIPIDKSIQFKFLLKQGTSEEVIWQPGPNRVLKTWDTKETIVILEDWENVEFHKITEVEPLTSNTGQEAVTNSSTEEELLANSNPNEPTANPNKELSFSNSEELNVAEKTTGPKEESIVAKNILDTEDAVTSIGSNV